MKEEFKERGNNNIRIFCDQSYKSAQDETFDGIKLLAQAENQTRRQKCTEGILKRLQEGLWLSNPPRGYEKVDKHTKTFW